MSFEVSGRLHADLGTRQVSERFRCRDFVLEIQDGNYPQFVKFQLTQDKCDLLDNYRVGEDLKVSFNLSGRESQDRNGNTTYFTNLTAWRVDPGTPGASPAPRAERGGGEFTPPTYTPSGDRGGNRGGGGGRGNDRGGFRDDRGGPKPPRKDDGGGKGGKWRYNDDDDDMPF